MTDAQALRTIEEWTGHRQGRPVVNPFPDKLHFDNAGMVGGRRCIVVTKPFRRVTSRGIEVIPAGTISNGASIPQAAMSIIGHPLEDFLEDAICHDFDYSCHGTKSRKLADELLRETMWNRNFPLWKIAAFFAAVRLFGWRHFKGQAQ
jgi:hypothetical protein